MRHGDLRKIIGVLMGIGAASSVTAQTAITIDSSFGRTPGQIGPTATNTTVTGNRGASYNVNNLYTIAEAQGRTAGVNLFHSFGTFNVGTGDAAVFTTSTPTLQNIIARVSGTSASTIQGLLAVNAASGSNPNFFLINPAGVTFGAGAQVDVPAAFHVSTANELRFADGSVFKAGTGPDSSMTVAAPEAFGFVGGNAGIAFNGVRADGVDGGAAFSANSFDVTAGSVTFDSSAIFVPQAQVRLLASGATANSIPIDGAPTAAAAQGDLRLTSSSLDAGSNAESNIRLGDAGSMLLLGREVVLEDSILNTSVDGRDNSGQAGTIRIRATGDVTLKGATNLRSELIGAFIMGGRAGSIEIVAQGNINAASDSPGANDPRLSTRTVSFFSVASSDGILLQGGSVSLSNTQLDASTTESRATPISILSGSTITLTDTEINSNTSTQGAQPAGNITLRSLGGGDIVARDSLITNRGDGSGAAGDIQIETTGDVQLLNSTVSSEGFSSATGDIGVRANKIQLNGTSSLSVTLTSGTSTARGGIGTITLSASERVIVDPEATIQARSAAGFDNPEDATPGQVRINTPRLDLAGRITTETTSNVDASRIVIDGGSAALIVQGPGVVTSSSTAVANSIATSGDAGSITLLGRDITVSGVQLRGTSDTNSTGAAGSIQVAAANDLAVLSAQLQTDTAGPGKAGNITLAARTGTIEASQIQSQASAGSTGQAGTVAVSASESLNLTNSTLSVANDALAPDPTVIAQGLITVDAPTLTVRSSLITAESSLNVTASSIAVNADSGLTLDQATVSSTARGTAAAGDIAISSNGIVALTDSSITGEAVAANTSELTVTGSDVLLDGTSRFSTRLLGGPAMTAPISTTGGVGAIRVAGSNRIVVGENSSIDARAAGSFTNPEQATPGEVRLTTPRLEVAGTITTETLGNVAASNIAVDSGTGLSITGSGVLTSSTSDSGNAGNIDIGASRLSLSGITVNSATTSGSSGSAGTVTLHATNDLAVANATVRTDTAGSGNAGNVALAGRTSTIDASLISSQAASGSSGQTGTIDVTASNALSVRGSTLSIANAAQVAEPTTITLGRIRVDAPRVTLENSAVTAQASANVAASAIAVNAPNGLVVRNSNVTTSAQDGNGGNIDVLAPRFLVLDKSQISTSVLGNQSGSGGNITVRTNVGVINNGFIQANTAAPGASGGNVVIDVGQLLPIGRLVSGGNLPLSFDPQSGLNAIQAAAPDGVSGAIQLTGPALDIVGSLSRVEAEFVATTPLGQDLCRQGNGSSLTQLGRGGLRPLSTGLLRPDTSLPLLPELPALSLRLTAELPFSSKCGH